MLRTLPQTRAATPTYRLVGIAVFTLITILSARITIDIGVVPFSLTPLAVVLSGMVLGARDGFASQLAYVLLIAAGLPLDARGLGAAALVGPTGGYIFGYVPAAGLAGLLAELGAGRLWWRWLSGIAGIAVIYLFGIFVLMVKTEMDVTAAWSAGVAPFIVPDLAKALIAAALAEGGRKLLTQRIGQ